MAGKVAPFEETVTGTKTEEEAAGCSAGEKAADAVLVGIVAEEEKPAAAAAADDNDEIMYVMSQEQVDYILSWDLEEDKFNRFDDDSDAWNKAYDFFSKARLDTKEYQQRVRKEYETYGNVRVEFDEEEEKRMSEAHEAAFLKAFGPDFRLAY